MERAAVTGPAMDALLYTLIATGALAIAFYVGRWVGIKFMMNQIEKELRAAENSNPKDKQPK